MAIKNALAGVAVGDLHTGIAWFTKVIGREPDNRPMPEAAEYELPGGGWIQILADKDRAGHSSLTLTVDDLDAEVSRVKAAGVEVGEPVRTEFVDTAIAKDGDGNQIVFAQAKSAANRSAA